MAEDGWPPRRCDMTSLSGKTLFISGGSRGIGKAIALRAARDGANIVIAAKTDVPHPKLHGTIHTAAAEIEAAGGKALPVVCDIRHEDQVRAAVERAAEHFGSLDLFVNTGTAISPPGPLETPINRFDLMMEINPRGPSPCPQPCTPHLRRAATPHTLPLPPPLDMRAKWF